MGEEKLKLQDLVKSFAKRAMKGVSCSLVDMDTGAARPATYFVDRFLQQFTLTMDEHGELPATEETQRVGEVSEIFVRKAGVETLKPEAAAALDDESKERVVVIAFGGACVDARRGWSCLLVGTVEDATSFAVCMRALHLYCKQKGI